MVEVATDVVERVVDRGLHEVDARIDREGVLLGGQEGVDHHDLDRAAAIEELADDVAPDEARSADDEDPGVVEAHSAVSRWVKVCSMPNSM